MHDPAPVNINITLAELPLVQNKNIYFIHTENVMIYPSLIPLGTEQMIKGRETQGPYK